LARWSTSVRNWWVLTVDSRGLSVCIGLVFIRIKHLYLVFAHQEDTTVTSALSLAEQGFPVTLVERKDFLGGHAKKFYRTWNGRDVQDYLRDLKEKCTEHPDIDIRLGSQITNVSGSVGNFNTELSDGSMVRHGTAIVSIGAESYKPKEGKWNFLYGKNPNVHTLLELDQRFINEPEALTGVNEAVFIHCVGSRIPERPYCSRVCCTHAIDQALKLKEINPDMRIFMIYRDIRTYGFREKIYEEARKKGIIFIRYDLDHIPEAYEKDGDMVVEAMDFILERKIRLRPDLLILASAVRPRDDVKELSKLFKCSIDENGFLLEAHMKLKPVDFATEGVFLCGLCHYPKPVEETITQAKAAASRAAVVLSRDFVQGESVTAIVFPQKCTGCAVCTLVCPYSAVTLNAETGKVEVDQALCKGCGACVASCRSSAISLKNIGNEQIMAAVEAAMEAV
jgi:heterodisulfide reductase subunit A-like polyferredoxin